ncbi:TonB-dependent receptor [Proteobacteria bacterium 005FR1]|nr:TonB-dependent receptor [Proteobacteria bacterium 005FR1]
MRTHRVNKLSMTIALLASASAAQAQDRTLIEEVIVTGSRIQERIDEVPSSVSIIDSEAIAKEIAVNPELQNILATRVPGIAPSTNSTSNFGQTLRGRSTLVMIDGVPQSTPLRNGALDFRSIDASALERIEVVKGATSVYGNGAAGGIINYITRRPGDDPLSAQVQFNSRSSLVTSEDSFGERLSGTVHGTSGDFNYVVNAAWEDRGVERDAQGDIIGMSIYGLSDVESRSVFSKFGYNLDAEKSFGVTYTYYQAEQDSDLIDVVGNFNAGLKTYAIEAPAGTEILGEPQGVAGNHNVVLQYRDTELFPSTRLAVDAYWQEIENVFFYSSSFADPVGGYQGGNSVIGSDKSGLRVNFDSGLSWSNVDATLIYGIDLLEDVTSQYLADGRSWVPEMDMSSEAAYLQSKFMFAEDFVLKAGVRREFIDIDVPDFVTLFYCPSDTCFGGNDVEGGKLDYAATTYNVGFRYNGFAAFSPFISYSEGFDVSDLGLLLRAAQAPDIDQVQTEASIIEHVEIGFSGYAGKFNYEVALYRSESELGTATRETAPGSGIYLPERAPQEIEGYEVALGFQAADNVELGATYSRVEGENPDNDEYLDARKIAPSKFTAFVDWQPLADLSIGVNYLLVGSRDRFDPPYTFGKAPVERYDIVNLTGSYQYQNLTFSVGVENLLNEDYFPARAQSFANNAYYTKGVGRTMNLGVNYQF